jgi:hypothetical protein
MRPDPQHRRSDQNAGRIIYIGDVRKRRRGQRQTPDRYYLTILALVAAMGWAAWLTVVMSVAPSRLLSYVAFFTPLAVALVATGTVGLYAIDWWRGALPSLQTSLRRAVLVTAVIEVNLAFLGGRHWLAGVVAVSVAAAVLIEVAFSVRNRRV